jgi:hypothetical protein
LNWQYRQSKKEKSNVDRGVPFFFGGGADRQINNKTLLSVSSINKTTQIIDMDTDYSV